MRTKSVRQKRVMGEVMFRIQKARADEIEQAKLGAPTPSRKGRR